MLWLLLAFVACEPKPKDPADPASTEAGDGEGGDGEAVEDGDGDGSPSGEDCDDGDAEVSPDAVEVCDGIDNDCDGQADEGVEEQTWWSDLDGDGYGDPDTERFGCAPSAGWASQGGDCDDGDAGVSPGAAEVACNGADDDCDRSYGDGLATTDGVNWQELQVAVDSLVLTGGTVTLCEGTFPALSIATAAPVHLIGSALGSEIYARHLSSAVQIEAGEVTLERLELTGGVGSALEGVDGPCGGGLLVHTVARARVLSSSISSNVADFGGGICLGRGASLELVDSQLADNEATVGGGIFGAGDNTVTLSGAYITDNVGESGAGISLQSGASVTADGDSFVTDNHASGRGGGVELSEDSDWTGGIVLGNNAPDGAGFAITCAEQGVVLTQITIVDNHAERDGGALAVACSITAEELTIFDNSAGVAGGALSLEGPAHARFSACSVTRNDAKGSGRAGGAQIDEGVLESVGSDWGAGGDDNDPVDVRLGDDEAAVEVSYGADATFVCTASGERECH